MIRPLALACLSVAAAAAAPSAMSDHGADQPGDRPPDTRVEALAAGVDQSAPGWATLSRPYDRFHVVVGDLPQTAWPGGGLYGAVSAITGALAIPAEADADLASPGVSRTIVNAGVSGLAVTYSLTAPAVGLYGGAGLGREGGGAWAANITSKNFASSAPGGSPGFNGMVIGIEGDLALRRPANGWAGSNADGIWLPLDADSQPDGEANMLHIGAVGAAPWKNGIKIDPGAATYAREVGPASRGPGPSIGTFDHFIVRDPAGQVLHIIQGYDDLGNLVVRSLTPGAPPGLQLQDAAGHTGVSLDGRSGNVELAGALVSRGARPSVTCPGAVLDPDATDLRGRVTIPAGQVRCIVHLASPGPVAPYLVVSGDVPGVAPAVLPPGPGEAGNAFTLGLPEGVRVPVTVTWIAIR